MPKLTQKAQMFSQEYVKDFNATQAAIRAGYSKKTAYSQGQRLLKNVEVQQKVKQTIDQRARKCETDAEYVLRRHVEIDKMSIDEIFNDEWSVKPIAQWPDIWRQFISGLDVNEAIKSGNDQKELRTVVKKLRWPDKLKNLEMLGKHVNVSAYSHNLNVNIQKSKEEEIIEKMSIAFSYEQCAEVFKLQEDGASLAEAYNQVK